MIMAFEHYAVFLHSIALLLLLLNSDLRGFPHRNVFGTSCVHNNNIIIIDEKSCMCIDHERITSI
jgi:hypothetical protein